METAAKKLREDKLNYEHFITRIDTWLIDNGGRVSTLFQEFDTHEDGFLSYDDFKAVMFDLNAPCNSTELHLLAKLLDALETGNIEYRELRKGLRWYLMTTEAEKARQVQSSAIVSRLERGQSARDIARCTCCQVGLWTPASLEPRYILGSFKLVTFMDTFKNHPCHFKKVVHAHVTVYALIQLIKQETGIQSTTLTLFRDKSRTAESSLPEHASLDELGYDGGSRYSPTEHTFLYDYTAEFDDCPILLSDHYFTETLKL